MNTPTQTQGGESATPRTDVHEKAIEGPNPWSPHRFGAVPASFARRLERETATLHAQIARMKRALEEIAGQTLSSELSEEDANEADFDSAYDTCIECARTLLQSVAKEGEKSLGDTPAGEGRGKC